MAQWTTTSVGPNSSEPEPLKRGYPADLVMAQSTERPLNPREAVLLQAVKVAIAHGWKGWITHVNDAVTVGQEAEGVLRDYRKGNKPLEPLLFDHEFAKAIAGEELMYVWLSNLAVSPDRITWLRENIWNG